MGLRQMLGLLLSRQEHDEADPAVEHQNLVNLSAMLPYRVRMVVELAARRTPENFVGVFELRLNPVGLDVRFLLDRRLSGRNRISNQSR